ncbi:MAG TPA: ATP-binding protein [Blastocatellia bacterium]
MTNPDSKQILSRLPDEEYFDREAESAKVYELARSRVGPLQFFKPTSKRLRESTRRARNALVLGAPRSGKTELLAKTFDRLFDERGDTAPFYYRLPASEIDLSVFARDYLSRFLAQFIAFRRGSPELLALSDEPLPVIVREAPPEYHLWARALVDNFSAARQAGDLELQVRRALSAPTSAALRTGITPFVMVDDFHLFAGDRLRYPRSEFLRIVTGRRGDGLPAGLTGRAPLYVLSGARGPLLDLIPPDEELFDGLELIRLEPLGEEHFERLIRASVGKLGVDISDSTVELMMQQLGRDLFYTRSLIESAASRGASLKTFMEFERIYTDEVLGGRISHYLSAVLRELAPDPGARRAALELLALVIDYGGPVPADVARERILEHATGADELLARLAASELVEISYGFVSASSDTVLKDYVRAKYRSEIAGARRPIAGEELLGEKLKDSYRLMMSRYNRAVESQLAESLSRFDFQSVPAALYDINAFDKRYRGMSRVQVRRALDEEQERLRLPQMVLVEDAGAGEQPGVSFRLFAASGFEGGIYSEANEVLWLIALINSKEPLDLETLNRVSQRLESASRANRERSARPRVVRWYVSKEGFSAMAGERLAALGAHTSTYLQLDLLYDYLLKVSAGETGARPASQFELVIPVEEEAELIAARLVEQIARSADFEQESINQIKTALIEACINAAEHSDSPDRRIHQRFALDDDRLIITVTNKGKSFGPSATETSPTAGNHQDPRARGRGLQIIRALMDEVRFDRTDDGATLVMAKYLKRPSEARTEKG